jgi:hypothetical protein
MRTLTIATTLICGLLVPAADAQTTSLAHRPNSKEREPISLDTVLSWLPTDTEALSVAQSFDVQIIDDKNDNSVTPATPGWFVSDVRALTSGPAQALPNGKRDQSFLGKRLAIALCAQREFDAIDMWGSNRDQRCNILVFQEDLAAGGAAIEQRWRKECKKVQTVEAQNVYCFDRFGPRKPYVKDLEWEGTFICRPAPNILICANQLAFLKTVLERRRSKPKDRALPDHLPFWKTVDRKSPAWMVRHAVMKTPVGRQAAAWTLAVDEPARLFVLNFSPDDPQSAATSGTAASRIADWAKVFELVWELKPASDGSARLQVKLPKPQFENPGGWVAFGFFFMKIMADPIVTSPE